jgi:transposase
MPPIDRERLPASLLERFIDPMTGEVHEAHLFVAALGASSYTYAEARWSEPSALRRMVTATHVARGRED